MDEEKCKQHNLVPNITKEVRSEIRKEIKRQLGYSRIGRDNV